MTPKYMLNDNFQSCKFWNAVTKTFDTKNILKEVMIWQNTGNVLEERFSNEGCTLERRKNIGNPTPNINIINIYNE